MTAMTSWLLEVLSSFGVDSFEWPGAVPWLALLICGLLVLGLRRAPAALLWSATFEAGAAGRWRRELTPILALSLRGLALLCLALVLAGPMVTRPLPPEPGLGLDLVVVLDTSASMRALDTQWGGRTRTRLDLAKQVVSRFAESRVAAGDRVGLVVFGERAFTQCPLTSDGELLLDALARVQVGIAGESTALGDALVLALERVAGSGKPGGAGRLVVLLTDGRSNAGAVPVSVAAELARADSVRVHTVGIGTSGEEVPMAGARDGSLRFERHDPDLPALRAVARASGGRFFEARRARDLESVYSEIDSLERVDTPLPVQLRQSQRPEPLLAAAGGLLLAEIFLARLLRRRLP